MKRIVSALLIMSALVLLDSGYVGLCAANGGFDDIRLQDILDLAVTRNAAILAARERIEQSRADVRAAGARLGPSITGEVGAEWNNEPRGASRNVYGV